MITFEKWNITSTSISSQRQVLCSLNLHHVHNFNLYMNYYLWKIRHNLYLNIITKAGIMFALPSSCISFQCLYKWLPLKNTPSLLPHTLTKAGIMFTLPSSYIQFQSLHKRLPCKIRHHHYLNMIIKASISVTQSPSRALFQSSHHLATTFAKLLITINSLSTQAGTVFTQPPSRLLLLSLHKWILHHCCRYTNKG